MEKKKTSIAKKKKKISHLLEFLTQDHKSIHSKQSETNSLNSKLTFTNKI